MALLSIFDFSPEKIKKLLWGYERLAASIFGDAFPTAGALLILFGCIAGGAFFLYKKKESQKLVGMVLVVLIAQAYQLIVCFTLPDAWEERYLWGGFTVMMLCAAWGGIVILEELFRKIQNVGVRRKAWRLTALVLTGGILVGEFAVIDGGKGIAYLFHPDKDVALLKEYDEVPWIVYGPTVGAYSYYDWIIPEQICFLSQDNTTEDAEAFGMLDERECFVLYVYEEYLSQALDFFGETAGRNFHSRYLTRSTNLTVYLVEAE